MSDQQLSDQVSQYDISKLKQRQIQPQSKLPPAQNKQKDSSFCSNSAVSCVNDPSTAGMSTQAIISPTSETVAQINIMPAATDQASVNNVSDSLQIAQQSLTQNLYVDKLYKNLQNDDQSNIDSEMTLNRQSNEPQLPTNLLQKDVSEPQKITQRKGRKSIGSLQGIRKPKTPRESTDMSVTSERKQSMNSQATKIGRWTRDEHYRFVEALKLYGREWRKVQEHVATRSSTQARSHAQKFFVKLEKKNMNIDQFLMNMDLERTDNDVLWSEDELPSQGSIKPADSINQDDQVPFEIDVGNTANRARISSSCSNNQQDKTEKQNSFTSNSIQTKQNSPQCEEQATKISSISSALKSKRSFKEDSKWKRVSLQNEEEVTLNTPCFRKQSKSMLVGQKRLANQRTVNDFGADSYQLHALNSNTISSQADQQKQEHSDSSVEKNKSPNRQHLGRQSKFNHQFLQKCYKNEIDEASSDSVTQARMNSQIKQIPASSSQQQHQSAIKSGSSSHIHSEIRAQKPINQLASSYQSVVHQNNQKLVQSMVRPPVPKRIKRAQQPSSFADLRLGGAQQLTTLASINLQDNQNLSGGANHQFNRQNIVPLTPQVRMSDRRDFNMFNQEAADVPKRSNSYGRLDLDELNLVNNAATISPEKQASVFAQYEDQTDRLAVLEERCLPHSDMIMSLAAEPEQAPAFKNYMTEAGLDQHLLSMPDTNHGIVNNQQNSIMSPTYVQRNSHDWAEANSKTNLLELTPQGWKKMIDGEFQAPELPMMQSLNGKLTGNLVDSNPSIIVSDRYIHNMPEHDRL